MCLLQFHVDQKIFHEPSKSNISWSSLLFFPTCIDFQVRELPDNYVGYKGNLIRERGVYRLDLFQTSEITFEPTFLPPCQADKIFSTMQDLSFDDIHTTRSVVWFGPTDYVYGSARLAPYPTSTNEEIDRLCQTLEAHIGTNFNSCLVNLYRDEKSMVPKHADDEKLFGEDPVIASLSLGSSRRFILESKLRSNSSKHCFLLQAGDLLVMKGQTQKYWLHSVPPEKTPCGPRINLTFRNVVNF